MRKITLCLFLICSLFVNLNAQNKRIFREPDQKSMAILNSAEFIFEGILLSGKCYYNADSTKIYTSWKVNITNIYKGRALKEGTVEFVLEGGRIGMDERYNINGVPPASFGKPFIFLCKKTPLGSMVEETYDNPLKLDFANPVTGYVLYVENLEITEGREMHGLNDVYFKTKQDFENTIKKVSGVRISKKKSPNNNPIED